MEENEREKRVAVEGGTKKSARAASRIALHLREGRGGGGVEGEGRGRNGRVASGRKVCAEVKHELFNDDHFVAAH